MKIRRRVWNTNDIGSISMYAGRLAMCIGMKHGRLLPENFKNVDFGRPRPILWQEPERWPQSTSLWHARPHLEHSIDLRKRKLGGNKSGRVLVVGYERPNLLRSLVADYFKVAIDDAKRMDPERLGRGTAKAAGGIDLQLSLRNQRPASPML